MKSLPLLLALALLLPAGPLAAQSPSPAPAEMRFRTLGLDVNVADLKYSLKDKDVTVGIFADSRSVFYKVPPANPVVFYRVEDLADGTQKRVPVIQADLSAGGMLPLLLFSKDPQLPGGLKVEVLKDDLKAFPAGSFRILNREPVQLGAYFANKPTIVPAASEVVIAPTPQEGRTTVFFQLFRLGSGGRQLAYSNNWAVFPDARTMVVVAAAEPPSKQPSVRRITESVGLLSEPPPKAQ